MNHRLSTAVGIAVRAVAQVERPTTRCRAFTLARLSGFAVLVATTQTALPRQPFIPAPASPPTLDCPYEGWTPGNGHNPQNRHVMAFDSARGVVVMIGFLNNFEPYFAGVYEWEDELWILRTQSGSARHESAAVFDSREGVTIGFGGAKCDINIFCDKQLMGDTYTWDGVSFVKLQVAGPSPRAGHAMAYDAAMGVTILFGGRVEGGPNGAPNGETWQWDGAEWTQLNVEGPSARFFHAMAYDASRHAIVLFGGTSGSGESWEWDGENWALRATTGPEPRYAHCMAYDAARERVVLFGGYGPKPLGDTWEWDGQEWTLIAADGPPARFGSAAAYDAVGQQLVIMGGKNGLGSPTGDTWTFDGPSHPSFLTHPSDTHAWSGRIAELSAMAGGLDTLTYQWRRNNVPLQDDERITGSNTPTLRFDPVILSDQASYDVVVTNRCGQADSEPATLQVDCYADLNGSGEADIDDFLYFQLLFAFGNPLADCDESGLLDIDDFICFQMSFAAGCQ